MIVGRVFGSSVEVKVQRATSDVLSSGSLGWVGLCQPSHQLRLYPGEGGGMGHKGSKRRMEKGYKGREGGG